MAVPFLKWAGGKRWFTSRYLDILPQKYNRYIEPFVGSGALFFALEPREAVIGDINKPLVETYMAIPLQNSLIYREDKPIQARQWHTLPMILEQDTYR